MELQKGLSLGRSGSVADVQGWLTELAHRHSAWSLISEVLVPISGMQLEIPEFRVGSVLFCRADARLQGQAQPVGGTGLDRTLFARHALPSCDKHAIKALECDVYALVSVPGDHEVSHARARVKVRSALDLLQFVNSQLNHFDVRGDAVAGIKGELPTYLSASHAVNEEGTHWTFGWSNDHAVPLTIDAEFRRKLRSTGFGQLIVLNETAHISNNELEKRIVRAVHWFAQGTREISPSKAIVNYVNALETIVPKSLQGRVRSSLATGVERILRQHSAENQELLSFIDEIYGVRSELVHGDALTGDEIKCQRLKFVTWRVIETILRLLPVIQDETGLRNALTPSPHREPFLESSGGELNPAPVGFGVYLQTLRRKNRITKSDYLARRLTAARAKKYPPETPLKEVTSEDVDRWERSPKAPALDMVDLIAETLNVPFADIPFGPYERVMTFDGGRFKLTTRGSAPVEAFVSEWPGNQLLPDREVADQIASLYRTTRGLKFSGATHEEALDGLADLIRGNLETLSCLQGSSQVFPDSDSAGENDSGI